MPKKAITLAQFKAEQRGDNSTRTQHDRAYDQSRPAHIRAFYGSTEWQATRRLKLSRNPLCECCEDAGRTKEAKQVHHAAKLTHRWDLRCEPTNLISVCTACHAEIEARG